jgi:hypothetical protein
MDAGIYFPLFLVLKNGRQSAIYYLSADLQDRALFEPRKPLGAEAKRAGLARVYLPFGQITWRRRAGQNPVPTASAGEDWRLSS